jgi:phosphatidate cytidylyltransferase
MKRVLTAVILIPLVLLAVFRAPLWLFSALILVIAALALHEFFGIVRGYGVEPLVVISHAVQALFFVAVGFMSAWANDSELGLIAMLAPGTLLVILLFVVMLAALGRSDLASALPSIAYSTFGLVYIGFSLATIVFIRISNLGSFLLLYLFVVVWSGDTFAYYVGRSMGRHKLAPAISPKKTWEGAIASVVGSSVLGVLLLHFMPQIVGWLHGVGAMPHLEWHTMEVWRRVTSSPIEEIVPPPMWVAISLSVLLNIAAQLGDLVESQMKRGANIKDSGTLLPGHGGILDRIDALLLAAPAGLVLFEVFAQKLVQIR